MESNKKIKIIEYGEKKQIKDITNNSKKVLITILTVLGLILFLMYIVKFNKLSMLLSDLKQNVYMYVYIIVSVLLALITILLLESELNIKKIPTIFSNIIKTNIYYKRRKLFIYKNNISIFLIFVIKFGISLIVITLLLSVIGFFLPLIFIFLLMLLFYKLIKKIILFTINYKK